MEAKLSAKEHLIKQIVNRLRKFGFVHVNEENIRTDEVYSLYFSKILVEMLGENTESDQMINELLKSIKLNLKIIE
ncbi:MAG: hypothetical protein NTX97_05995 [Bacteroidetes bacterium]|nr:hypothetical protein [Bacteroidota bacterium]